MLEMQNSLTVNLAEKESRWVLILEDLDLEKFEVTFRNHFFAQT